MNTKMIRRLGAIGTTALLIGACSLDLENPNNPTEDAVVTDPNGVYALAVGLQAQFAQAIEDYIVPSSLVTDEWGTRTRALLSYQSLFTGQNFENTYDVVNTPYAITYQIAKTAQTLMTAAADPAVNFGPALQGGFNSIAKLFRAMALGMAAQTYETLPVNFELAGATPRPRAEALDTVIALLESARADILNVTDAQLAPIRTRALGSGINLRNTIDAMIARYALFRGQYQKAIDAATRVSPTVLSTLTYPAPTINPVYGLAITLQYVGGTVNFVSAAETGDRRPGYWLLTTTAAIAGNPADSLQYTLRKYSTQNEAFPLYLPDEMKLIQAEAQARLGNLPAARTLINQVRTQATSALDEPVAGLTALTDPQLPDLASILRQIGYERRYELYMQGMRWEDIRRLSLQSTVTFPFLPLPAAECRNNPNAGC